MACEPATAIRPADAARENIRSRREGTWKECTTRTETRSTVSGSSTDVISVAGALTAWTNQTDTPIAPAATTIFTHPGGSRRVTYENTIPRATRAIAPRAAASDTSPIDAQAAIAAVTVKKQAARSRIECSGGPGRFAFLIASSVLTDSRNRRSRVPRPVPGGALPRVDLPRSQ